jgi:hypothetical protein
MNFSCVNETEFKKEIWEGVITKLVRYGSHYEILIKSRSSIMVLFGKSSRGGFASMPDFGAGCHLIDFKDKFWNTEKLTEVLGKVDGITVATALYTLSDRIRTTEKQSQI